MADAGNDKTTRVVGIDGLVSLFMAAAAVVPLVLLLAAGAPLFAEIRHKPSLSFESWSLLIVLVVLGTAFLIARVFSAVLARQIRPMVAAAVDLAGAGEGLSIDAALDLDTLAAKFDQVEAVLFESRKATLGRIRSLETESARLRDAAQAQTRFLSDISHEIRTPLSAIVAAARIIQRYHEKNPEVIDRFGGTIVSEGNRLVGLISDLLDVVKIEAGTLTWEDGEVRPAAAVTQALGSVDDIVKENHLQLSVEVSDHLPVIWADARRVVQVIENLVRHAARLTPAHGRIEVRARDEDGAVHFVVSDTGKGIPADVVDHLFDKSSSIASRWRRGDASTGLGLSLCRDIVTHYGGRIWAQNGARSGAEIHVLMPGEGMRAIPDSLVATTRRSVRVLLLMKNSVLAECAVRALRLEDIESRVSSRLQDALMILANWTPEVLVVSPSFAWQLSEDVQDKIRKLGVAHILMFSQQEGFVEMNPPTHIEPLLAAVSRVAPVGSRILFVEDDLEYGSVVEFELSQAGYIIERTYNGVDAVAAVAQRAPQVMILDLALPQLDGFGVLSHLRQADKEVPTIVLTALDDPVLDGRLRDLGAANVFRKFELILAAGEANAMQVREILTPVLAANPSEVSREAGLLASGNA